MTDNDAARAGLSGKIDCLKHELNKLRQENLALRKSFMAFFEDRLNESMELKQAQKLLGISLLHEGESMKTRVGEQICSLLNTWHAPFSLFFRLIPLWFREVYTKAPASLGGNNYYKIISAYEKNGFGAVAKLLDSKRAAPIIRGNAYTALARNLIIRKQFAEACEASKLAYEADPRYYRLKWHAFRLFHSGSWREADLLLSYLADKIPFSASEEKIRREIGSKAWGQAELDERAVFVEGMELALYEHLSNYGDSASRDRLQENNSRLLTICRERGWAACLREIRKAAGGDRDFMAQKLIQIGRLAEEKTPEQAYRLSRAAARIKPCPGNIRAFFWTALNTRHFLEASQALAKYENLLELKVSEKDRPWLPLMKASENSHLLPLRLLENRRQGPDFQPIPKRLCYVLHNSLPWSSGGYATRGQGVAKGLASQGFEVICLTRPGYPEDIVKELKPESCQPSESVDGINYLRTGSPLRNMHSPNEYMELAADALTERLQMLRPEIVIAASNHLTALPALIAARRLGLPFIYEVRGLWEITRMSREKGFENTNSFLIQKILETEVCKQADHVFAITGALKNELIDRGVAASKITIAPNACDPGQFAPMHRDVSLAAKYRLPVHVPLIGYIGTFVNYEGLDLLARACGILKERGRQFRLLLVGNENASGDGLGPVSADIRRIAQEGGFADWLIMTGRVPYEDVARHYSLIDIAPFPRMPWPVCEIVSPMKPLEAMSMAKAVVASSVAPLAELVEDGKTGLLHTKGDVADLAEKLDMLLSNPELRDELGKKAREFVLKERTWERIAEHIGIESSKIIKLAE